jgi:steroid delta-isomerase-like uncharacterized protein
MEYGEVCKSHNSITDFRAKLLALLPIASGSGIFLLLTKRSEPFDTTYLYAIGLFGFLITLGLFIYELRGIQHCKHLEQLASRLEEQLHLHEAQFMGRPKGRLGGFVGAQGAAYIIYPTMLAAWICVAFVGFTSPKATAKRAFKEILSKARYELVEQLYAKDFVAHGDHHKATLEEDQAALKGWHDAFPDIAIEPQKFIAEGDLVAVYWTAHGTNTGTGNGLPATGKKVELGGITIWRIVNGKIKEEWSAFDQLSMMQQLGLLPAQTK